MKNVNKKLYNRKGFTLAEMLLTVSIIIILGAVIAVNVIRYRQNLKLTEMDNAAREIYMAAQNHLSESVSTGEWGQLYDSKVNSSSASGTGEETKTSEYFGTYLGSKVSNVDKFASSDNTASKSTTSSSGTTETTSDSSSTSQTASAASTDTSATSGSASQNTTCNKTHAYYYLVVNSTSDLKNNAMEQILPNGSIDETVRKGNYIIEYDAIQGQVYDVFYTDADVTLSHDDVEKLDNEIKSNGLKSRSDSKSLRKQFSTMDNKKVALGYYGSATATDDTYSDEKITVDVKNGNRLYLIVNVPDSYISKYSFTDAEYKITLKDLRFGASGVQGTLKKTAPISSDIEGTTHKYVFILDSPLEGYSIAQKANIDWKDTTNTSLTINSNNKKEFNIGDNLRANVTVTATKHSNSKETKTFKVTSEKFNSAFAEGSTDKNAQIQNARHLQNLAIAASASDSTSSAESNTESSLANVSSGNLVSNDVTTVKILNDITWYTTEKNNDDYFDLLNNEAKTYNISNTALANAVTDHGFTGIQSRSIKSVTGSIKRNSGSAEPDMPILSGFSISDNCGYNGLFANMTSSTLSIKNLSLKDFNITNVKPDGQTEGKDWVKAQKEKAIYSGALLGYYKGKTLIVDQASVDGVTENFTSIKGILAGGLVGYIDVQDGKANITDCFASVNSIGGINNFSSTNEKEVSNIISQTNIGGLIGSTNSGTVNIKRCYSSGRTINGGDYDETKPNLQVVKGNVGGFIGNIKSIFKAEYCYSTCSVGANNNISNKTDGSVGGFIGFMGRSTSASYCYSTGEVINLGDTAATNGNLLDFGQFIGQVNESHDVNNIANCFVLAGINYDTMPTIWKKNKGAGDQYTGIKIKSSSDEDKNPFNAAKGKEETSDPKDDGLKDQPYPYCTTNQLEEFAKGKEITKLSDTKVKGHVGDWPVVKDAPTKIGLIYYEKIKESNGEKKYYFHGYWETLNGDSDYKIEEMNNVNKIPKDDAGYVIEDGYALAVQVDSKRKNTVPGLEGISLSDKNIYIGTEKNNIILQNDNIKNGDSDNIGLNSYFDSYKLYVIPQPEKDLIFSSMYDSHNLEIFVDLNGNKKGNPNLTKFASFNVNLYSADAINPSLTDTSNYNNISIRSSRQLYNLYWKAQQKNNTSYLANPSCTINQEMDIDFNQEFTRRQEGTVRYDLSSKTNSVLFACTYKGNNKTISGLNTGTNSLFGSTCTGKLENLNLTNVSGKSLFDINSGTIDQVKINGADFTSSGFANVNNTVIKDSSITNARIQGNGATGLNQGQITGTNLVNVKVSKSGFVENNTGTLVDDHIYADLEVYKNNISKDAVFKTAENDLGGDYSKNSNNYNLYNLTTIGFAYKSSTSSDTNGTGSIGGFVYTNSGDIYGCSVTGTVCATANTGGFAVQSQGKSDKSNSNIQGNYANVVIRTGNNNSRNNKQIKNGKYAAGFIGTATGTNISDNMVTGVIFIKKNNNGNDNCSMSGFINQLNTTNAANETNSTPSFSNNYSLIWRMNAAKGSNGKENNKDYKAAFCMRLVPTQTDADLNSLQNNGWLKTSTTDQYKDGISIGKGYSISDTSSGSNGNIISIMTALNTASQNASFGLNTTDSNNHGVYLYEAFTKISDIKNSNQSIQAVVPYQWTYNSEDSENPIRKTTNLQTWYGDYYIGTSTEQNTDTLYSQEFGNNFSTAQNASAISVNLAYIYQMIIQKKGLLFIPKMKAFF